MEVLLKKDFLTLRRNKGLCIAMYLVPVALMIAFIELQTVVDKGPKGGSLVDEHFKYSSNLPWASFEDVVPLDAEALEKGDLRHSNVTTLLFQTLPNQEKYSFTQFAIVNEAGDVQCKNAKDGRNISADAKAYFEDYVFPITGITNFTNGSWSVALFDDQEVLFDNVRHMDKYPYCCALTFKKFNTTTDEYEIEFSLSKSDAPDTNQVAFSELLRKPDFLDWNLWMSRGGVALYPYITEFITRCKAGAPMETPFPLFLQ